MKKLFIISLFLLLSLCGTGCVRITQEAQRSLPPPYRFYSGTRGSIFLPFGLAIMGSVSHAPRSSSWYKAVLPITLIIVDFPLEVAVDTILLPVDLGLYSYYSINPPLDRYLSSNDLKGLETQLMKGVSPNVIDPWFMKKQPLLCQAYWNHNEDAFELLLNYGAKVPIELLQVESYLDEYTYRMLQRVFRNGCPKELQLLTEDELRTASDSKRYRNDRLKSCFSYWILKYLMYKDRSSPNDKLLVDIMVLLLENGFSPNKWEVQRGDLHYSSFHQYPLDVVMANSAMDTAEKDRLITAMRKHGAQTYRESIHLPPSESVPTMFQPVIDAIAQSRIGEMSPRVSILDSFQCSDSSWIEGPVLVIDIPLIQQGQDTKVLFRKSIPYRRRISATEWNQEREFLEVPEKCRLVFTPLGKRLPSRRPQGMPTQRGFWETWLTLPTCELYIERTKYEHTWFGIEMGKDDIWDLLQRLIYAAANAKQDMIEKLKLPAEEDIQAGSPLDALPWNNRSSLFLNPYREKGDFAPLLDEVGKLPGVNTPVALRMVDTSNTYVFSTHRDMKEITEDDFPLVPHPEEVLVMIKWQTEWYESHALVEAERLQAHSNQSVLSEANPSSSEKRLFDFVFPWGKEGKNYWNWRIVKKKWDMSHIRQYIYLFYGDAVSEERLNTILDICERHSQNMQR